MTTSKRILQRDKNSMSFEQIGQILVLSDRLNKYKEGLRWAEKCHTKIGAQKYIDKMCAKIDEVGRGGKIVKKSINKK